MSDSLFHSEEGICAVDLAASGMYIVCKTLHDHHTVHPNDRWNCGELGVGVMS